MSIQSQVMTAMVNNRHKLPENESPPDLVHNVKLLQSSNVKSSNVQQNNIRSHSQSKSSEIDNQVHPAEQGILSSEVISNGGVHQHDGKSSEGQKYSSNGQSLNSSQISSLSSTTSESIRGSEGSLTKNSLANHDQINSSKSNGSIPVDKLTNGNVKTAHDELFPNLIFDLKELFRLSVRFTRENENKAFHPTYDDRNYLYALNYQIKYGQFVEDKASQLGALDFVGKDRRFAWRLLGDLSKEEAMKQFISKLDQICPSFKPFIEAHNQERVEREKMMREEEEKKRIEEERRLQLEQEENAKKAEEERKEKQRLEIKEALRKQTYYQFKSYARDQYPDDQAAQDSLIKSLEDIHFQQYLERIAQIQERNRMNPTVVNTEQDDLLIGMQQFNLNSDNIPGTNMTNSSENPLTDNVDNQFSKINQQEYVNNQRYMLNEEDSENEEEEEDEEENSEESDNEGEEIEQHYEGKVFRISPPHMWTKKIIKPFKESISIDSGDGIVKLGYGETLTIRVPTHPEGNCIVWEFATDNYDIGFGLFFEPNENPGDQVTLQISESEEEDEDEDDLDNDPEKGSRKRESKKSKTQFVLPIIPIFRRDSHEEVYAGSHVYCGKGVYLLKFDNSYSLWRSKTLYYRVFFSN